MTIETPKRILAIDFGTSKIGLAISDELNITSQAISKIPNDVNLLKSLNKIVEQYNIGIILVGIPSESSIQILSFIEELERTFEIPIKSTNEDFTTKQAIEIISNKTKKKSRYSKSKEINDNDSLAAQIMLQNYLENPI